jgi:hypothetical protein
MSEGGIVLGIVDHSLVNRVVATVDNPVVSTTGGIMEVDVTVIEDGVSLCSVVGNGSVSLWVVDNVDVVGVVRCISLTLVVDGRVVSNDAFTVALTVPVGTGVVSLNRVHRVSVIKVLVTSVSLVG